MRYRITNSKNSDLLEVKMSGVDIYFTPGDLRQAYMLEDGKIICARGVITTYDGVPHFQRGRKYDRFDRWGSHDGLLALLTRRLVGHTPGWDDLIALPIEQVSEMISEERDHE